VTASERQLPDCAADVLFPSMLHDWLHFRFSPGFSPLLAVSAALCQRQPILRLRFSRIYYAEADADDYFHFIFSHIFDIFISRYLFQLRIIY
jgi:(2Fe-2S) ferredoxin